MPKIGLALQTVSSIGLETALEQELRFFCRCLCANVNSLDRSLSVTQALPVFGCLSCASVGSGTLIKPDTKEGFKIFQILPFFSTCGRVFVMPVLQSSALLSGHRGWALACDSLPFCCKHHFWEGWLSPASSPPNVTD